MNKTKLHTTIKLISDLLAEERYLALEELSKGIRLSASQIKAAVLDYGCKVVKLPDSGFEKIDIIEIKNSEPKKWSVNIPIYTEEEGLSDLTLETTLCDTAKNIYEIEIYDLHVL